MTAIPAALIYVITDNFAGTKLAKVVMNRKGMGETSSGWLPDLETASAFIDTLSDVTESNKLAAKDTLQKFFE